MKLVFIFTIFTFSVTYADIDPEKYLRQFGYLDNHSFSQRNVSEALLKFQKTFGLQQTGVVDENTLKLMKTPRCGMKDHVGKLGYVDTPWSKKQLTYFFDNYTPDMPQNQVESLTKQALKYWSDVSPLIFTYRRGGDIVIAFGSRRHNDGKGRTCHAPFDGPSGVLAHAFFPPNGRLHFDEDERYTHGTTSGTNYLWVATHELGHILGLEHDQANKAAVMYPYYNGNSPNGLTLHSNDIRRIQRLYGKGKGGTGGPDPPKGDCVDVSMDCQKYTQNCNTPSWKTWISNNCRKTCGKCGTTGGGNCVDVSMDCHKYTLECNTPSWKTWINNNCRKTCGKCGTTGGGNCKDKTINCDEYVSNCNVQSWKQYMQEHCRKTCNFC